MTHSAASGDIDNDGDIDIYVGNIYGGNSIPPYMLINNGVGEFTKSSSILPATLQNLKVKFTYSLLFDANNDGWMDIVVGGDQGENNRIFLNDQGQFSDSSLINLPESTRFSPGNVVDLKTHDFNNDGIKDIVLSSTNRYVDSQIQILINDGLANFTDETETYIPNYLQEDIWSSSVHIVDINDDSYKDLLLGRTGTYYLNDGSGIFSTSGAIPQLKWRDYEVVNIDSDIQSEIVFQNHQGGLGVMDFM